METMRHDPAADSAALGFAVLVSLSTVAGVLLLASGALSPAHALVVVAGLAFGVMAPGRWLAALGGAAAAGALGLALPGASPWAGALVLPGVAVGSWVARRPAPDEAVPWPDAVLAGLCVEVTVLLILGFGLPFAAFLAAALGFGIGGAEVLGAVLGVAVMLAYVVFAGWLHVRAGQWAHHVARERFAAFAVGQVLPAAGLAFAIGEPEGIGFVSVLVALRVGLIHIGYARTDAVATAALAIAPPSPVAEAAPESASSFASPPVAVGS